MRFNVQNLAYLLSSITSLFVSMSCYSIEPPVASRESGRSGGGGGQHRENNQRGGEGNRNDHRDDKDKDFDRDRNVMRGDERRDIDAPVINNDQDDNPVYVPYPVYGSNENQSN